MPSPHVIVVGAGPAGIAAAAQLGTVVRTTVVSDDPAAPYNRTAVNKGLLLGAVDRGGLGYPEASALGLVSRLVGRAVALDPGGRKVTVGSEVLPYDAVLVATGAAPVPAPPAWGAGARVHRLHSPDDGLALRERVGPGGRHVVVVGAGLIGTETTGVLHDLGCTVTLVSREASPMRARWGRLVAGWLLEEQRAAGTHLLLGHEVQAIDAADGRVRVRLTGDVEVDADDVVLAIGHTTTLDWLAGTGLVEDGAVPVDRDGRTGVPGVYAAGEASATGPARARHPHWGAALHQGRRAARAILADLGLAEPLHESAWLPSYSSYFRDAKLTVVGDATGYAAEHVVAGEPGPGRWTVALTDGEERLLGVVGVRGARVATRLRDAVRDRAPLAQAIALL